MCLCNLICEPRSEMSQGVKHFLAQMFFCTLLSGTRVYILLWLSILLRDLICVALRMNERMLRSQTRMNCPEYVLSAAAEIPSMATAAV